MLARPNPTAPHRQSNPAGRATPPSPRPALALGSRDVSAARRYTLPAVREVRRTLDATFDPDTW
jgi:hypothetical protein